MDLDHNYMYRDMISTVCLLANKAQCYLYASANASLLIFAALCLVPEMILHVLCYRCACPSMCDFLRGITR